MKKPGILSAVVLLTTGIGMGAFGATAYVSKAGNDGTAALGNPALPYLTVGAAKTALKGAGAGPHVMSFQDSTESRLP